jgi:hypothetical protein
MIYAPTAMPESLPLRLAKIKIDKDKITINARKIRKPCFISFNSRGKKEIAAYRGLPSEYSCNIVPINPVLYLWPENKNHQLPICYKRKR